MQANHPSPELSPTNFPISAFIRVRVFYYIVKEQASKRLPFVIAETESLGTEFLESIWSWWLWTGQAKILPNSLSSVYLKYIHKAIRSVEKSVLLISTYFFRPSTAISETTLSLGTAQPLKQELVIHISNRLSEITTQLLFRPSDFLEDPQLALHQILSLKRFKSFLKLIKTCLERQKFPYALVSSGVRTLLEALSGFNKSSFINHISIEILEVFMQCVSSCFYYFGSLLQTEHDIPTQVAVAADLSCVPFDKCADLFTCHKYEVWNLLEFSCELALLHRKPNTFEIWLYHESSGTPCDTNAQAQVLAALGYFLFFSFKSSYGTVLEEQLKVSADTISAEFMNYAYGKPCCYTADKLFSTLNYVILLYALVASSWTKYGSSAHYAQGLISIPSSIYQKSCMNLLQPAFLDKLVGIDKLHLHADLDKIPPLNMVESHHRETYQLYIVHAMQFIQNWAKLVSLKLIPDDQEKNCLSVITLMPMLLLWTSVITVPVPLRITAISTLHALFDVFADHPIWWLGCSQFAQTLQSCIAQKISSIVKLAIQERSAVSDLFLSGAIDLVSQVSSSEDISECLTFTLKMFASTVEPGPHSRQAGTAESAESLVMSVTSFDDEDPAMDISVQQRTQHQDYREELLLQFIERTWADCRANSALTPTHSIVLDNLVYMLFLQWSRYISPTLQHFEDYHDAVVKAPFTETLPVFLKLEDKRFIFANPISQNALRSVQLALKVFNIALDAMMSPAGISAWLPHWHKADEILRCLVHSFTLYPYSVNFNSMSDAFIRSFIDTHVWREYLKLVTNYGKSLERFLHWIVHLLKATDVGSAAVLSDVFDIQFLNTLFELLCSLVLAQLAVILTEEDAGFSPALPLLHTKDAYHVHAEERLDIAPILFAFQKDFLADVLDLVTALFDAECASRVPNLPIPARTLGLQLLSYSSLLLSAAHQRKLRTAEFVSPLNKLTNMSQSLLCAAVYECLLENNILKTVLDLTPLSTSFALFTKIPPLPELPFMRQLLRQKSRSTNSKDTRRASRESIESQASTDYGSLSEGSQARKESDIAEFVLSQCQHQPANIRQSLDALLGALFQPFSDKHVNDIIKVIVLGFSLFLLEATDSEVPLVRASCIAAVLDSIVCQVPCVTAEATDMALQRLYCECCSAIFVFVCRQVFEMQQGYAMHRQEREQVSAQKVTVDITSRPSTSKNSARSVLARRNTTNSGSRPTYSARRPLRYSNVSSYQERLSLTDSMLVSPLSHSALRNDFLLDNGRVLICRDISLSLPFQKREQILAKYCVRDHPHQELPDYLYYVFEYFLKWTAILKSECPAVLNHVVSFFSDVEKPSELPSFRTIFLASRERTHHYSLQSGIYDEIDMETAHNGFKLFEQFCQKL